MNGKQKCLTSAPEGCPSSKLPKVDFAAKENDSALKVYPKRNRTPSAKAFAAQAQPPNVITSTSTSKVQASPVKQVLSPLNIHVSPMKSIANIRNSEEDLDTKEDQLKLKPVSENMLGITNASKKAPKKTKNATPKNKKAPADENKRKRCMPKTVDKRLQGMGIDASQVSNCLKSAMCKGFVKLTGDPSDLEQVIIEGEYDCHTFKVLLKDVLYQPDYGGDYEDGSLDATATCSCCVDDDYPGRAYITRLCIGQPELDSGKFHNHCTECKKGFGVCLNDYRMAHCSKCNKHWFCGLSGFPCDNCERARQQARGLAGLFMMDSDEGNDSDDSYRSNNGCTIA